MKYILTIIILLALCLNSCKMPYYIPVSITDSTYIHRRDSIVFDTIKISVPAEEKSEKVVKTDTSILQTSIAISEAYITADGRLFHSLRIKSEKLLKVPVHYVTSAITNNRIRIEPRVVEVEKKLNRWQELKMQVGGWAMVAIAALIIFYAIKICRRFKII
jgi:hypothetical protein